MGMVTASASSIVPQSVMSPQGEDGASVFSVRKESVPMFDKVEGELPAYKNWFEEGVIGAAQDQFVAGASAASWAFSTVSTLQALAAINGG